jgi:hypothetical protein
MCTVSFWLTKVECLAYSLHTSSQRWNAASIPPAEFRASVLGLAAASTACLSTTSRTLCSDGTAGTASPGAGASTLRQAGSAARSAASRQPVVLAPGARAEEHRSGSQSRLAEDSEERRAHAGDEVTARRWRAWWRTYGNT